MPLELMGVHVYTRIPGTQQHALSKVNPAMRIGSGMESIYIQGGRYWDGGGNPIKSKDLPAWAKMELQKCNPAALAECGIHVKVVEPPKPAVEDNRESVELKPLEPTPQLPDDPSMDQILAGDKEKDE